MNEKKIPLIVLGGSDRRAAHMPDGSDGSMPLAGVKAVDVRIRGRRLIDVLLARLREFGRFHPLYIAGPKSAYQEIEEPAEIIDTDGPFGRNIQNGIEATRKLHPEGPLGIITCDIVPEIEELELSLRNYENNQSTTDLWFPIIRTPRDLEELGASAWKPKYHVQPEDSDERVQVLPGHLVLFDPEALRLKFIYRLMDLAYRTRNRPIYYRRSYIIRRLLLTMLVQDVIHVLNLRLPTFTWDTLLSGFFAAKKLRNRVITQGELELALRRIFSKRRHRKRFPDSRIRTPILDALSLARDIDTREEAAAFGGATG